MIDRIGLGTCFVLLFVWSLPGTVTLRYLLLFASLVFLARHISPGWRRVGGWRNLPLALLAISTLWLAAQAVLVSSETAWALRELRGQWLSGLLALILGLALASYTESAIAGPKANAANNTSPAAEWLLTAVVVVFGSQALIAVGYSVWYWFVHGSLLRASVPLTGGRLEMSFLLNLLLAFISTDLFCRATHRQPPLRLSLWAIYGIGSIALFCSYLAGARNGFIGIGFLGLVAMLLYVFDWRHRLGVARSLAASTVVLATVAVITLVGVFNLSNYRGHSRWETVVETATMAWDIDNHRYWRGVGGALPRLGDGREIEESTYSRVAWFHVGLRLIKEHPFGIGYGRNAFAHALLRTETVRIGHAHSGWIDLGVGGGWPTLVLWASFLAALTWRGWKQFFDAGCASGLALVFVATGFAVRMLVDSVNKDHMLQIFLFLVGILLVLTSRSFEAKSA
jgi:hypothetical protein